MDAVHRDGPLTRGPRGPTGAGRYGGTLVLFGTLHHLGSSVRLILIRQNLRTVDGAICDVAAVGVLCLGLRLARLVASTGGLGCLLLRLRSLRGRDVHILAIVARSFGQVIRRIGDDPQHLLTLRFCFLCFLGLSRLSLQVLRGIHCLIYHLGNAFLPWSPVIIQDLLKRGLDKGQRIHVGTFSGGQFHQHLDDGVRHVSHWSLGQ
mmetsp:Transcript_61550/g.134765  ORF Transcript_61550/g.134765 Transcript_61550/m.134765 type:complete len:206 (+) Transcript_61550:414-1031(+)